jgi:hypothetical protein
MAGGLRGGDASDRAGYTRKSHGVNDGRLLEGVPEPGPDGRETGWGPDSGTVGHRLTGLSNPNHAPEPPMLSSIVLTGSPSRIHSKVNR